MCEQKKILEKIHEKGVINGHAIELAEAQARDYETMDKKVIKIQKDVNGMKKDLRTVLANQAKQSGQIELIVKRLNSPVEKERIDSQKWNIITSIARNKGAWIIFALVMVAFALAGDRIASILGDVIRKLIGG